MSSALPQPAQAPARPGRRPQTVADMVRSLALVLVGVFALVLLVPRPSEPIRQPVDVAPVAERAAAAGLPAAAPRLPNGWWPNAARFSRGPDQVQTWHVGYVTPSDRYAGVEMAADATPRWTDAVTADGVEVGTQEIAGSSWTELHAEDGRRRSLLLQDGAVTTVVTGTAGLDELAVLARAVAADG